MMISIDWLIPIFFVGILCGMWVENGLNESGYYYREDNGDLDE